MLLSSSTHRPTHPPCTPQESSHSALSNVLSAFEVAGCPTYHTLGNHCLTNLPRAELNKALSIPPTPSGDGGSFYAFVPAAGWRFVVLDSYDVSLLGWPPGHPRHQAAEALLHARNPNEVC